MAFESPAQQPRRNSFLGSWEKFQAGTAQLCRNLCRFQPAVQILPENGSLARNAIAVDCLKMRWRDVVIKENYRKPSRRLLATHMYASQESHRGIVPLNHSN
jgi:hypothetical protein